MGLFGLAETTGSRLRMMLLMVAVVVSIWLPAMVERHATQESITASQWVSHSADVRAAMFELLLNVRTMQSLVLDAYIGGENVKDTQVLFDAQDQQLDELFQHVRDLTLDNPEQQSRIGGLRSVVDGRVRQIREALQSLEIGNQEAAHDALLQGQVLFPFRSQAQEVIDAESELFKDRSEKAEASHVRSQWISLAATAAQLVLLAILIMLSEQQVRRRQRAEQLAQRATARAQRIVQTVPEPIAVLDSELRLVMANASFDELYAGGETVASATEAGIDVAKSSSTAIGLSEVGQGAWSDPVLLQRLRDVTARDREVWDYELDQRKIDGIERTVVVNACRMVLPELDGESILLTVSDVTARKRNEEHVERLNRDLEARVEEVSEINRELEAFSYSVSHDLRAPLRHIAGFGDKLALHLGSDDATANHYLHVMGDAARRMSQLIDALLLYSRLGRHALRVQTVDMHALVMDVRRTLAGAQGGCAIKWSVEPLPAAVGDENMLRQVWQNLLENAIKYSVHADPPRIEVRGAHADNGECVYSVRDNGAGFDMEYAANLFGVFQRMHRASEYPGTGIGLANVRRIITRHGGRIWADAAVGEGATFHFSLPAAATNNLHSGVQA